MPLPRVMLHIDMDAFFASIVQWDSPELRGKPVLVGHDGPRGVVCAASYEARPFGCRSAMPMVVAKRMCPQAVVVPVPGRRVRECSGRLFELLHELCPLVEPLSVDEAFADMTGTQRLYGSPEQIARRIRAKIHERLSLTASVGVAPNKFLAKLASDMNKPDGLTITPTNPDAIAQWLAPLPIGRMWGIGQVTEGKLLQRGVRTIGDLQRLDPAIWPLWFGNDAEHFRNLCFGIDDRIIVPDSQAKSIGHEQTFDQDIAAAREVRRVLAQQTEQVGRRLRRLGLKAGRVTVKIRFGDFQTITRSVTLDPMTDASLTLWEAAKNLFETWANRDFHPVRLIGMTAAALSDSPGQLGLFDQPSRQRLSRVDHAMDRISQKFGGNAITRGSTLPES
ncbi:MAG: DNA polymerase IV [Phycisphaeraceae bacterium]